ncbi:MAG: hypothetical protein ACKUBY_00350 [Candidatus Moraniibacteriota bacterium]|jgi:hypothetical protein
MPDGIVTIKFLIYVAVWIVGILLTIKYCWKDGADSTSQEVGDNDSCDVKNSLERKVLCWKK